MTPGNALCWGGWDPRYAVVRALVVADDVAAVLVDPNGDGGSIDVDQYRREPDGSWVSTISGGSAGDSGAGWTPELVTAYGRAEPGARVLVHYLDRAHEVMASAQGWWLFAVPSRDGQTLPEVRGIVPS